MVWNKCLMACIAGLLGLSLNAQIGPDLYLVYFADKDNTPFNLDNPEAFLTQRALDRRANQGIELDETDLPVDPIYLQAVVDVGEVVLRYPLKWVNGAVIATADSAALVSIAALPFVVDVRRAPGHAALPEAAPDQKTPRARTKSGWEYGLSWLQLHMVNGLYLHEEGFQGQGMRIAVTDGGFLNAATAGVLQVAFANGQVVAARDFTTHPGNSVFNDSGHGTRVLSIMAGFMQDSLIGSAPGAEYGLFKTENVFYEYRVEEVNWAAGAELADSLGFDLINVSLGYTRFNDSLQNYTFADLDGQTTFIARSVNHAADKGMLVVVSAGNYAQQDWYHIGSPADAFGAFAIGSVNWQGFSSAFSSRGPSADGRIKPDVVAQGQSTIMSNLGTGIQTGNGTSFSAPVICGMAACLWQKHPTATNFEIMDAIRQSAHLYTNPNDSMGHGIPNMLLADQYLQNVLSTPEQTRNPLSLQVFPNPAKDWVWIRIPEGVQAPAQAVITDIAGKQVYASPVSVASQVEALPLSRLSSGIYLIRLEAGGSRFTSKLVILE